MNIFPASFSYSVATLGRIITVYCVFVSATTFFFIAISSGNSPSHYDHTHVKLYFQPPPLQAVFRPPPSTDRQSRHLIRRFTIRICPSTHPKTRSGFLSPHLWLFHHYT